MLESFPHDSYHKFELPEQNLLPPTPEGAEAHLEQISQQLFALCYNVETFVNRPKENCLPDLEPEVWNFLHEVINFLPRTLENNHIEEARYVHSNRELSHSISHTSSYRIDLYQALYKTERLAVIKSIALKVIDDMLAAGTSPSRSPSWSTLGPIFLSRC